MPRPVLILGFITAMSLRSPKCHAANNEPLKSAPFVVTTQVMIREARPTDVASLARDCWEEFSQKLGTNVPACVLVCDNLNDPAAVAVEMEKVLHGIPWAGISRHFRFELPFEPGKIEQLAQGRRGIAMAAFCGELRARVSIIEGAEASPPRGNGLSQSESEDQLKTWYQHQKLKLEPRVTEITADLAKLSAGTDRAILLLMPKANDSANLVKDCLQSQISPAIGVESVSDSLAQPWVGNGVVYGNQKVFSNAVAIVCLHGRALLREDKIGLITRSVIQRELCVPFREWARAVTPHPLEIVSKSFGDDAIRILQYAEKVEAFRIQPRKSADESTPATNSIEGYPILARASLPRRLYAKELSDAILSENNNHTSVTACEFSPGVAYRIWHGRECATALVCFQCKEIELLVRPGSRPGPIIFGFQADPGRFLALARQAFPDDPELKAAANPKGGSGKQEGR
jgi:hypothetical protein